MASNIRIFMSCHFEIKSLELKVKAESNLYKPHCK